MPSEKKCILIVEDDVIMGMQMHELLENFGYEIAEIVSSGESAIKAAQLNKPDLVFMDIRLKGSMDGIEAAKNIRFFSQVPILFLTGYKNIDTAEQIKAIRNSFLVTKPFDPDDLGSMLKKIFCG